MSNSILNSRVIILAGVLAFAATRVSAHGFVNTVTIDGKSYPGWQPFVDPYSDPVPQRIVRRVASDSPVLNTHDASMACNVDGEQGAGMVADVKGGSSVTFTWNTWPTDHHGPVTTYMASCGGSCKNFAASSAEFFKIDQAGYIGPGQFWATDKLIANNFSWTVKIPTSIADGEYLVRHEILALHSIGQPQFYPSCTQVRVDNGGSGVPSSSEVIKAVDIYDGFTFPDIWNGVTSFKIAGPSIAKLVAGSSGGSNPAPVNPAPAAVTTKAAKPGATAPSSGNSPAPTTTSPKKQCRRRLSKKALDKRHKHATSRRMLRHERKGFSASF